MFSRLIALITAAVVFLAELFLPAFDFITSTNTSFSFEIDSTDTGDTIPNYADNLNIYEMGRSFVNVPDNRENDVFEFVKYVQFINCTGGSESRDCFRDPLDFSVRDDYDFENLINNCRGVLKVGAKPHLVTGNVPLKLTSGAEECVFSGNVYPPDDYNEYYNYIATMGRALVDAFGKDEVLTWRFGVFTEFENSDWFLAKSKKPEDTAKEYCKIYDYTVKALQDTIGENIYIGAHCMAVTEGYWDEELFIKHVATETNYATGEKGTRISYFSGSFYDYTPEKKTSGMTLYETMMHLKNMCEKYGLTDLVYGIDEGRILSGTHPGSQTDELLSRSSGYTMQGAFDARCYTALWDSGTDYFSYWSHLSGGVFNGNPTVSYHVSKLISGYEGMNKCTVRSIGNGRIKGADVSCRSAVDSETGNLKFYVYNQKYDMDYNRTVTADFNIRTNLPDGEIQLKIYRINDDCNWFDEWQADRKANNIQDSCWLWSPDDGCVNMLTDAGAREFYTSQLSRYAELSVLTPETITVNVDHGYIRYNTTIEPNTVVFFETVS